jgi:hypothetical protein
VLRRRAVRRVLRHDRAPPREHRDRPRLPPRVDGEVASGTGDLDAPGLAHRRHGALRLPVRRTRPPEPPQSRTGPAQADPGARSRAGPRCSAHLRPVPLGWDRHHPDPRRAERRHRSLPAACVRRSGPGPRNVEPVQRVGDPAQPEVHRLPGVEPKGQENRAEPRQPTGVMGLVAGTRAPSDRVEGGVRTGRRPRRQQPSHPPRVPPGEVRIPVPGHPSLRDLRAQDVGEPQEELRLLLVPALAPASRQHPGGPPASRLSQRTSSARGPWWSS